MIIIKGFICFGLLLLHLNIVSFLHQGLTGLFVLLPYPAWSKKLNFDLASTCFETTGRKVVIFPNRCNYNTHYWDRGDS